MFEFQICIEYLYSADSYTRRLTDSLINAKVWDVIDSKSIT